MVIPNEFRMDSQLCLIALRFYENYFLYLTAALSAPSGPIKIKDITSDSVSFDWSAPKEDGGLPILSYNIMKSENDGDWVKLDNVDQRTTSYKARNLTEGNRYMFRVVAVNKLGEGKPLDSDTTVTKKPAGMYSKGDILFKTFIDNY